MLRELEAITCLVILLYDRPGATACLPNEHDAIIDAIAAGDARRAAAAMREHLVHVEKGLDLDGRAVAAADLAAALSP
jgi:DNA-binding GntR family transcriptional regulator